MNNGHQGSNKTVKTCEHRIESTLGLIHLEKKPLDDYFRGTRAKKESQKTARLPKKTMSWRDFLKESQLKEEANESESLHKEENSQEENEEFAKYYKEYERRRMYEKVQNQINQRLEQERQIAQLENLAETWLKRSSTGLSKDFVPHPESREENPRENDTQSDIPIKSRIYRPSRTNVRLSM